MVQIAFYKAEEFYLSNTNLARAYIAWIFFFA